MRRRWFVAGFVLFAAARKAGAQANRPAPTTLASPPTPAAIDLNSASQDELMTLDGIGEVRAAAIIRARPFKAKTELVERHLIPESLYDRIGARVMVRPAPAPTPAPTPRR